MEISRFKPGYENSNVMPRVISFEKDRPGAVCDGLKDKKNGMQDL